MITIELPGVLQTHARASTVTLDRPCATVQEVLAALGARHPGVLDRVMDERGVLRPHVNVFVGDDSIRFIGGLQARVPENAVITILPAVSGG